MRKFIVLILSIVCATTMALGIAGCSNHTHTYSSSYEYNATHHWLPATCGCLDAGVKNKSEHVFELNSESKTACSVCGKKQENFSGGGGEENNGSNIEEIITSLISSLSNGLKLSGNYSYSTPETQANLNGCGEMAFAFKDNSLLLDALLKTDKNNIVFIRGTKIYLATPSESVEIADLTDLASKLNLLEFYSGAAEETAPKYIDLIGAFVDIIKDETIFEVGSAVFDGMMSYLSVSSEEIENSNDYVITIDFKATITEIFNKVKAVASYVDKYHLVKTLQDLYESDEFNKLISPLLENLTGAHVQALLTNALPLIETFILPNVTEIDITLPEAGNLSAYEYISKVLKTTITISNKSIKLGQIPLSKIFTDYKEDESHSLASDIQEALDDFDSIMNRLKLSFVYEVKDDEYIIKTIDFIADQNKYYISDTLYEVITYNAKATISIDFTYNDYDKIENVAFEFLYSENNALISDCIINALLKSNETLDAIHLDFEVNTYNEFGASVKNTSGEVELGFDYNNSLNKETIYAISTIKNNGVLIYDLNSSLNIIYLDDEETKIKEITLVFEQTSNTGVKYLIESQLVINYNIHNKISDFEFIAKGFAQEIKATCIVEYSTANYNLIDKVKCDISLNDFNLTTIEFACTYNSLNQITKISFTGRDVSTQKLLSGAIIQGNFEFVYNDNNALSLVNSSLSVSSLTFEFILDLKLELLNENYLFIDLTNAI